MLCHIFPSLLLSGAEGSSTESMSHMRQAGGGVVSSVEYTDTVVDQQYVLIEASSHSEVGRAWYTLGGQSI